jgi:hypothetical protein
MKRIPVVLLLLSLSVFGYSQNVSLFAGTPGVSGYNSIGTSLSSAKFNQPFGIARDGMGNFWISETGGQVIYMITSSNMVYVRAGSNSASGYQNGNSTSSKFNDPKGLAVGPNNEIYIADYTNNVIRKLSAFTSLGNVQSTSTFCGKQGSGDYVNGSSTVAEFDGPTDVAVDASGNVYVADQNNHVIRKITPSGTASLFAGVPNTPGSTDGNAIGQAKFNGPGGLYIKDSILYVSDTWGSMLRKINLNTGWVSSLSNGYFIPTDVIDYDGSLYFTDQHRIGKLTNTTKTTYAGSDTLNQSGYVNGFGTAARFYNVKGLVYNPADTSMLVVDSDNHVIRKVSLCPTIIPTISITGNTSFCDGDSVVLTGPANYAFYFWSNGDTTQSIVVKNSATLTLTVTNQNLCTGTSNPVTITKKTIPSATFDLDSTACLGIDDTITYTGNASSTATYNWIFADANITTANTQGPHYRNWSATGSKAVSLQVTENGCSSAVNTKNIQVYAIPGSQFTQKGNLCAMENDTITFTGQASPSASFDWNFGSSAQVISGSGSGPYIVHWTTDGQKTITLKVNDHGCISNQSSSQVSIQAIPTSGFSSKTSICLGEIDTIVFTGSAGSNAVFDWNFGTDATIISGSGAGPYHVSWTSPGNKNIRLIVTENNCSSSQTQASIQVNQIPNSHFNVKKSNCTFTNDTIVYTGNASTNAQYNWDFDSAIVISGSGQGPYIVYWQNPGTKMVSLQVEENGCLSSIKLEQVQITEAPIAAFACLTSLCQYQTSTVTFVGSAGATAVYHWDFDSATIISGSGAGPYVVQWATPGNKKPSLSVEENGCVSNFYTISINVKPKPSSLFTIATEVCVNKTLTASYTGNASASASYNWNFGSAIIQSGSGQGPYEIYWTTDGAQQINLTVSENGCQSTETSRDVDVHSSPATPTITQNVNTLTSSASSGNQWYDQAGMINGANAQNFDPPADGVYYVIVTNADGCSAKSADFNFVKVNIHEQHASFIKLYPNPAKQHIYVENPGLQHANILVQSIDGKTLITKKISQDNQQIDISHVATGIYLVKISTQNDLKIIKLLKE